MQPRDPAEEMLVQQLVWTHARIGYLTAKANYQAGLKQLQVVTEALERAHNTYRRLVLTLAEYRNPRVARNFTAIGQLNQAEQQVVQANAYAAPATSPTAAPPAPAGEPERENATNEKGFAPGAPALPPVGGGVGRAAAVGRARAAVAEHAGAGHGGGEGPVADERVEARRTGRGGGAGEA
jgi:hypothetical protein